MFAQSPVCLLSETVRKLGSIVLFITSAILCQAGTVTINPGDDIPSIVAANPAGTTFIISPGLYRLSAHIVPLTGDSFIGQTVCAPPASKCPAIISGSTEIGSLATFDGTNWKVTGQTQQGTVSGTTADCQPGYLACILPEDLFFDGQPYVHLYGSSLPTIGTGQWWFDYTNHIIYFHDNPSGHTVETSVLDTAFDTTANNVTIQYLTIEEFASPLERAGLEATAYTVTPSSSLNWIIEDSEILLNHGGGVRVAFGTKVLNNFVHDNGDIGVGGGLESTSPSGVVIQNNTIKHNNFAHVLPGYGAGGIKFGDTANVTVRGNLISNNDGAGIHFDVSSSNPLIDGNVVVNNSGGGGAAYEVSLNAALVRNNVLLSNGMPDAVASANSTVGSFASVGMTAYCNVVQVPYLTPNDKGSASNGLTIAATNRGFNPYPPYQYLVSTGNVFHHNTVIWSANATGSVGYVQMDAGHQPNFFTLNPPPDYNEYHLPGLTDKNFIYDNNNTQRNTRKTFADYQAAGADVHGTADTNNTSGCPAAAITSPPDQSTVTSPVTVVSTASDKSGISKVEFYADWVLQTTLTTPPYNFTWSNGNAGWHVLSVTAYSNAGISRCYGISVNMQ